MLHGESNYPSCLKNDLAPPAVLFYQGDLQALKTRRVGMIGTRSATASGRYFASHLAFELTLNGVCVVSGLARGIDGWAHRGALRAYQKSHGSDLVIAELRPPTLCARRALRGSLAWVVTAATNGVSSPAILFTFSDDLGNGLSSYAMANA